MQPSGSIQKAKPGRPSTGARERILAAAMEVLKADGYAGLTTAKVAARAGQNKALIQYHFGSKQGLVAAAAREVSALITAELLAGIEEDDVIPGLVEGLERILDRDEGLARVYFDLASQSIVEPEIRAIMAEVKAGYRAVLAERLDVRDPQAAAVYLIAALEGFTLERLERGETAELRRARDWFLESAPRIIA
ncbi:MAG: TetR/AcrR family transcriptional regulator [Thermoleophilaceae bacterium]